MKGPDNIILTICTSCGTETSHKKIFECNDERPETIFKEIEIHREVDSGIQVYYEASEDELGSQDVVGVTTKIITEKKKISDLIEHTKTMQILMCKICKTYSYREYETNPEEFNDNYDSYSDDVKHFVNQLKEYNEERFPEISEWEPEKYTEAVPDGIRQIYNESIIAYNRGLKLFCIAGFGILIEAVYKDKGIKGTVKTDENGIPETDDNGREIIDTSIEGIIRALCKNVFVKEDDMEEMIHAIRKFRNDAAHANAIPPDSFLGIGKKIIEDMLKALYEPKLKDEFVSSGMKSTANLTNKQRQYRNRR